MRNLFNNKKGAEMTVGMVITLIFAAAILVLGFLLIFNVGGLRDRIFGFAGGDSNIDDIRQQCTLACAQLRQNEYTADTREVITVDKKKIIATCRELETVRSLGCKNGKGEFVPAIDSEKNCSSKFDADKFECRFNGILDATTTIATAEDCKVTWVGIFNNPILTDKCTSF